MRTLHWSSTSFGYMKPSTGMCTCLLIARRSSHRTSSDRTIHAVVKNLCACRHVRFQNLHGMSPQKFVNRVVRILQVGELARSGGTDLATRRREPLRDPVITERAFLRRVGLGIDEAASVGAGLYAVTATHAVFLIDQDHAIGRAEGGSDRTHLSTG